MASRSNSMVVKSQELMVHAPQATYSTCKVWLNRKTIYLLKKIDIII